MGFTDTPSRVRERRIAILDEAIDAAESDSDFYWFEEGAWAFDAWHEHHRTNDSRLGLARRLLQSGRLGIGATWVSPLVAGMPEGLRVLTFHLEELDRDFGYRPSVALLNDSPSYPEALIDALAARGVRYLLVGANMFVSAPLPARLVRTPFWWESASGARVLTYVDPDGYTTGFTRWGIEPGCARAFEPERFPADTDDLATMSRAITAMLEATPSPYDALVVQHAFDNWDPECATRLPDALRRWNASGRRPHLQLAPPDHYFRHIEERYGTALPVYRGEWGGQWDAQRVAGAPISFWRLREAARALAPDAPRETKVAIATALDHNVGFGPPTWGFTDSQVRDNGRENAELIARAVRLSLGTDALQALPPVVGLPPPGPLPAPWLQVLASGAKPARVRVGPRFVGPFVLGNGRELEIPVEFSADEEHLVLHTRLDRTAIPGTADGAVYVVLEIPFRARREDLRLAPEGSPSALVGEWLREGPPNGIVIGPDGVRLIGLPLQIKVTSPVVLSWTLVPDREEPATTWLQGLLVAQSELCELKGGEKVVFPYSVLYPGEPAILDVGVVLELP